MLGRKSKRNIEEVENETETKIITTLNKTKQTVRRHLRRVLAVWRYAALPSPHQLPPNSPPASIPSPASPHFSEPVESPAVRLARPSALLEPGENSV